MIRIIRKFIINTRCLALIRHIVISLVFFWLYSGSSSARAQACPEESGQLVLYENFGTVNQRPSLAGQINYEYVSSHCPNDGQYTLMDFVDSTCFSSVWHSIPEDHTAGDVRGNMLLVNGWYVADEFYNQPVSGLCPGTTYEFSFWGVNLIKPDKNSTALLPIITARVETTTGLLVQTLAIGSIPVTTTPVWTRYSGLFTAPDTVSQLVIRLMNGKGGSGNDFGIDDIQIKQCSACVPAPLYVPDAFTPNNDGHNDEFGVFLRDPSEFDLKIYNQWGNLIFSSNSPASKWDGNFAGIACPAGSYAWVVTIQPLQRTSSPSRYVRSGRVLLLR